MSEAKYFMPIVALIYFCAWWAWIYSIGVEANQRLDRGLRRSEVWFSVFAIGLPVVVVMWEVGFLLVSSTSPVWLEGLVVVFCVFAFFYVFEYSARQLATVGKAEVAGIRHYIGIFFNMLLMPPLAIFFLQPRVNRLLGSHNNTRHQPDER